MTREKLVEASNALAQAASTVDDEQADRLTEQSEALMQLAERDQGPDHGRLARHTNILSDLHEETGNEDIKRALEYVRQYRSGVSGV